MKGASFRGRLVVVTGASSGLGRELARRLAEAEGADLVIAARRGDRLEALRAEIAAACPSKVTCVEADLGTDEGVETLVRAAEGAGEVFGLVNCAGLTYYGRTLDAPAGMNERIIALDLVAGIQLTTRLLPAMLRRGQGAVLTVTSLAATMPVPYQNVYAAAKHGMQSFMEGLARECRGSGVVFTTLLPGGIATEMITNSGLDRKIALDSPANMDPARAARIALRAWKAGAGRKVPGLLNKVMSALARIAPRRLVSWAGAKVYEPQATRMPKTGV